MSIFHRHNWRETQRVFTGPSGVSKMGRADQDAAERLIWGITTMLYVCDTCGLTRQIEIKGDARINGNIECYAITSPHKSQAGDAI